ncbi:hypothetical protein ACNKHM_03405 [Shigella sonnei]
MTPKRRQQGVADCSRSLAIRACSSLAVSVVAQGMATNSVNVSSRRCCSGS